MTTGRSATRRATKWAAAMTRRDRDTFIREVEPQIKEAQAKLAACRRLNRKGETVTQCQPDAGLVDPEPVRRDDSPTSPG